MATRLHQLRIKLCTLPYSLPTTLNRPIPLESHSALSHTAYQPHWTGQYLSSLTLHSPIQLTTHTDQANTSRVTLCTLPYSLPTTLTWPIPLESHSALSHTAYQPHWTGQYLSSHTLYSPIQLTNHTGQANNSRVAIHFVKRTFSIAIINGTCSLYTAIPVKNSGSGVMLN